MARHDNDAHILSDWPVLQIAMSQMDRELLARISAGAEIKERSRSHFRSRHIGREVRQWDVDNRALLESGFSNDTLGIRYSLTGPELDYWGCSVQEVRTHIDMKTGVLEGIRAELPSYESTAATEEEMSYGSLVRPQTSRVFVVHGHDNDLKYQVVEFLERVIGKRPIILHEQPDLGRTIIEKFEVAACEADFAVVLLTGDDEGRVRGEGGTGMRARQNVILELGFFIGRLGRRRVVALYEPGVELPSDLSGVLYKPLTGNWHTELARELRAAGLQLRARGLLGS